MDACVRDAGVVVMSHAAMD